MHVKSFSSVGIFSLGSGGSANRPEIEINKWMANGLNIASRDIFGNTIHELAHATHWITNKTAFLNASAIVRESYCQGVNYYLTNKFYYGDSGAIYSPSYSRCCYTGIVEDLVDRHKTTHSNYYYDYISDGSRPGYKVYWDAVVGYTMREIEDALIGRETWNQWCDNIVSMYPNKDYKDNVDEAFVFWNTK